MPVSLLLADRPGTLIERLALDLGAAPLSPFEEEVIVVQSLGMERWLRLELARRLGIAASLRVPFPAAFAHGLAAMAAEDPERSDGSPVDERFERDAMTWRILQLFEEGVADEPEFRALHALAGKPDTRARLGLAARIASRFDDYLLFRPETLLAWERNEPIGDDAESARWQAALWRRLCDEGEPQHLARWMQSAIERIERGEVAREALPPRVSVFGVSTLPPVFARLLHALARHVPVRVYLLAPPSQTWHGDEPRNPLFAAFGHASRELLALLAVGAQLEEHHVVDAPTTLLRRLQQDLREGVARGREAGREAPHPLDAHDRSLTVHDCHSPMRELEVLRDQLFDAFAADPTLRPHDVLVMVPDVAAYAPFVEAVLGVGEPELPRIPFHIADRPVAQESSIADALLRLLRLVGARWTATEIVELLDLPAVRRAAGISDSATRTIVGWVEETRIRWGRDGAMRKERFNLPALDANSWRAGLDRLLMGYATGRADALVAGVVPHAGDTIGDPQTLGALARWADRLFDALDALREPRTLDGWRAALHDLIGTFLHAESEREERELEYLRTTVEQLAALANSARVARTVDLAVVRDWIERGLETESTGAGFLAGGMTIGGLKPMRALPFRVIAILGLDDATFPRRDRRASWDLLELEQRVGDRDHRADDRQLFLDTLLSARDRIILSYVGRSAIDNSERAVSVVVAELLDIVDESCVVASGRARDVVCVKHRLQPFSPAYFTGDRRLFSFSRAHARAVGASRVRSEEAPFIAEPLPATVASPIIPLRDLIDCWTNPSRWFCDRTLGFRLRGDEAPLDDSEPMSVDGLARYAVHDDILRRHLRGARDAAHERELAAALGILPPGALARRWFDRLDDEISDLLRQVERPDAWEPVPIEIVGSDWTIVGRVDGITDEGRVQVRAARMRPKDLIDAWIQHLALWAMGQEPTSRVIATDATVVFGVVEDPVPLLDTLVHGLRESLRAPIPVFELASHAYVEQKRKFDRGSKSVKKPPIDAARAKYAGTGYDRSKFDLEERHVALCWRGRDPLADEAAFAQWGARIWGPLFENVDAQQAVTG